MGHIMSQAEVVHLSSWLIYQTTAIKGMFQVKMARLLGMFIYPVVHLSGVHSI